MAIFIGSSWVVFLPLGYFFAVSCDWGMTGAWWAGVIHFALVSVILLHRFWRGRWRERTI
ncbi:MAG: hypothetical protein HN348_17970 [Proteobacteria bacterium]|nr:hypothetical protein [Pseudomonadota bacterium]